MTDEKDNEFEESIDQKAAAEVDAVFDKLITDLKAYDENPMDPEDILKLVRKQLKKKA